MPFYHVIVAYLPGSIYRKRKPFVNSMNFLGWRRKRRDKQELPIEFHSLRGSGIRLKVSCAGFRVALDWLRITAGLMDFLSIGWIKNARMRALYSVRMFKPATQIFNGLKNPRSPYLWQSIRKHF